MTGSQWPTGCANGTYQDQIGQSSCNTCPSGYYCRNNATLPVQCPLGYYCPQSTAVPLVCPLGTYGGQPGLRNTTECSSCPAGKYCVDGTQTGNCSAGYYCRGSSYTPTPVNMWSVVGDVCPPGFYCPAGTTVPIMCPDGTVRAATGGSVAGDCTQCPAGYQCVNGTRSWHTLGTEVNSVT